MVNHVPKMNKYPHLVVSRLSASVSLLGRAAHLSASQDALLFCRRNPWTRHCGTLLSTVITLTCLICVIIIIIKSILNVLLAHPVCSVPMDIQKTHCITYKLNKTEKHEDSAAYLSTIS